MKLTPEACRAARAIAKWSMRDLAETSGVSWSTIYRLEAGAEARDATAEKIRLAFEGVGIDLIAEDGRSGAVFVHARRGRRQI